MSTTDIDRDERRSARDDAWRAGEDLTHPIDCGCQTCKTDEWRGSEAADPANRGTR